MTIYTYPRNSVVPRLTSIKPVNNSTIDVADGGGIRSVSLAAIQKYDIDLKHEAISRTELDALLSFYADYKDQQVAVVRADYMVYYGPFINEPEYDEISGSRFTARVKLDARRIPSYVPAGYGSFEPGVGALTVVSGGATFAVVSTLAPPFGLQYALLTKTATDGLAAVVALASGATTYNATVPGNRKWLLIQSVYQTGALRAIDVQLRTSDAVSTSGSTTYTPPALAGWYRFARIVDLTAKAQTTLQIRYSLNSAMASGNTCLFDGVTMLDITDFATDLTESAFPTAYIPPEL